jgi:hypothetical protein
MSWVPLSKTQHSEKALVKNKNFRFIEREIITDIFNFEFETAISCVPIFFAEAQNGIRTVGLMGLEKNKNLFVQQSGMWLLPHFIPATIASFPFRTFNTEDKKNIIVLKEDSDLIVDRAEGIPFFDKKGNETAKLKQYLGLFSKIIEAQKIAEEVGFLLKKLELLEHFNMKIPKGDGTNIEITGLLKIKASAFRGLGEDKFLELRKSSALDFIYAHFYSLSGIQALMMLRNKNRSTEQGLMELGSQIFDKTENEVDFNL